MNNPRTPVERIPWSEPKRIEEVGVMIHDRDAGMIWRRRLDQGVIKFGTTPGSAPTIDQVLDRPDLFRGFDATGKPTPLPDFKWLRDHVNNRTVSVHSVLVPGDLGSNNYPREFGVWTSGGFYAFQMPNCTGYTNKSLIRHVNNKSPVGCWPVGMRRFITTRHGYIVPMSTYQMVAEFLETGDMLGAYKRAIPPRKAMGSKDYLMSKARKAFGNPSTKNHLAHELKDAIDDRGLTVSWIAEQIEAAIGEAKGEKKIAGLKFLMEVHEASAVAKAQATGLVSSDLEASVDVLPTDRDPRQFTRGEIQTFMSGLEQN